MPYDGTQLNETAAHLIRAKRYIEEHGWHTGNLGEGDHGPRCLIGAVIETLPPGEDVCGPRGMHRLYWVSIEHLKESIGSSRLHSWNDAPGRTVEEVYAAFDQAIALAMETKDV